MLDSEGGCLKKTHEIICPITKKNTTYSPMSFPKSHGGTFTIHPYANKTPAASTNNPSLSGAEELCSATRIIASPPASSIAATTKIEIAV